MLCEKCRIAVCWTLKIVKSRSFLSKFEENIAICNDDSNSAEREAMNAFSVAYFSKVRQTARNASLNNRDNTMIMTEPTTKKLQMQSPYWHDLAEKSLSGKLIDRAEALSVLQSADEDLLSLLGAAFVIRKEYYGTKVKLNLIINAKCGHCPEDCGYCSQSIVSKSDIEKHTLLDKETIVNGAKSALEKKAGTYCIVASGRGPTNNELNHVIEAVKEIKGTMPLKICACLGLLKDNQAERLKAAGVDRYNHNINTSANHFASITKTHSYDDRIDTVNKSKSAGISPCSGVIIGMGESDDEIINMAFALRELDADSIPVNFLNPIHGTPLEKLRELTPLKCLKVLCLFRFICPSKEIRASGGRELNLRSLQPFALYPANSIFIGDYLTTDGQEAENDHKMITDLGFEVDE